MTRQAFAVLLGVLIVANCPSAGSEDRLWTSSDPFLGFTYEHQEIVKPAIAVSHHEQMTRRAIRDRVIALRTERHQKMPYLDRMTIRDTIYPEKVREKIEFLAAGEKNLQAIIDRAVGTHMRARAARERISLANRRILVAVRKLFPEVSFDFEERAGIIASGFLPEPFHARGYHFRLRQPIFRGGILWNSMLQETAELRAARKEYDKIIEDLVNDVAKAYFEYNRAMRIAEDQYDAVQRMKRYVTISDQKFREDLISEIEHLNVQSLSSQMQYDFETSRQELELAKLDLQNYLDIQLQDSITITPLYDIDDLLRKGRLEGEPFIRLEDYAEDIGVTQELPELQKLVDMAYQHRSELQVEAARLTSARFREKVKAGELLPHADILLDMGALGEGRDALPERPKRRNEFRLLLELKWNLGGNTVNYTFENDERAPSVTQFAGQSGTRTRRNTFQVNLFDGLEAFAELKEAEAEKLDRIVELENMEREVIQDVKQAYFEFQKALIQMRSSLKRLDYRERLVRLSMHRLEQNEIQISEYIQAEIDFLNERVELHRALKDYFTAKASLNRAVGIRNYMAIEEYYGD